MTRLTKIARFALPALLGSSLLAISAAHATITYTYSATDQSAPPAGGTVVDTFNGANSANETSYWLNTNLPSNAPGFYNGCTASTSDANCNSAIGAPPTIGTTPDAGAPTGVTGNSLAVSNAPNGSSGVGFFQINISSLGTNNISFYWGSVDTWNFVQLLDASGNLLGSTVYGTNLGSGTSDGFFGSLGSREFTFTWDSTDPVAILQFGDYFGPAFEVADVTTQVPEPNGTAILLAGLGFIELAGLWRRRVLSRVRA